MAIFAYHRTRRRTYFRARRTYANSNGVANTHTNTIRNDVTSASFRYRESIFTNPNDFFNRIDHTTDTNTNGNNKFHHKSTTDRLSNN